MPSCVDNLTARLQLCLRNKDLVTGRQVVALITESNLLLDDTKLACQLIRMFSSCGNAVEALHLFRSVTEQNVYTWTAIIQAHSQNGQYDNAIFLYKEMQLSAVKPSEHTFPAVLKACRSTEALKTGRIVHVDVLKQELETSLLVCNALIEMYAKCGCMVDARMIFDKLAMRDIATWNILIGGYVHHEDGHEALHLFREMKLEVDPNRVTFLCIAKACTHTSSPLQQGRLVHIDVMKRALNSDSCVGSILIHIYAECGELHDAQAVFDRLAVRDVVVWSTMVAGYANHGYCVKAFDFFKQMQQKGIAPNVFTSACIMSACAREQNICQGMSIHSSIIGWGFESDPGVGNSLVGMYAKCGELKAARKVFNGSCVQNVESWTAMLSGCAEHLSSQEAFDLLKEMQRGGTKPNAVTFVCLVKYCEEIEQGRVIHECISRHGHEIDLLVGNSLLDMYVRCDSIEDAKGVFDCMPIKDVVSWSTMIAGYAGHGHTHEALYLFTKMLCEGTMPNDITFVSIIRACVMAGCLGLGRLAHFYAIHNFSYIFSDIGSILIDLYAKCNCLKDACNVFKSMPVMNVVTWSAMITGYVYHEHYDEAIDLFGKMQQGGTEPTEVTFASILKACAAIADANQGKLIHADIVKKGFEKGVLIGNCLVDTYAKCSFLESACKIHDDLIYRDLVSWNSIILGYANHGQYKLAQQCFYAMHCEGLVPDNMTILGILSACSHAGLVQEGFLHFHSLSNGYNFVPTDEHYVGLVGILGRAGCLTEANGLIVGMPFQPNTVLWMSMLGSCAKHFDSELGKSVFDFLVQGNCESAAGYALMSNIYATYQLWDAVLTTKAESS